MEFGFDGTYYIVLYVSTYQKWLSDKGVRNKKGGEIFGILDLFSNPFLFFVMNIEF